MSETATFSAIRVSIWVDVDNGEGSIHFEWPDPLYGSEGLQINLWDGGFCSRNMAIRSGQGPPEFVELQRDRVILHFAPALAKKLELDETIEIKFSISDDEFHQLKLAVEFLSDWPS